MKKYNLVDFICGKPHYGTFKMPCFIKTDDKQTDCFFATLNNFYQDKEIFPSGYFNNYLLLILAKALRFSKIPMFSSYEDRKPDSYLLFLNPNSWYELSLDRKDIAAHYYCNNNIIANEAFSRYCFRIIVDKRVGKYNYIIGADSFKKKDGIIVEKNKDNWLKLCGTYVKTR